MLPLWRKRFTLALATGSLAWQARGHAPQSLGIPAAAGALAWNGVLAAMRSLLQSPLAENGLAGGKISVILADAWLHYALIPWQDDLSNEEEINALLQIQFETLFGAPAGAGRDIRADFDRHGMSAIACALDADFAGQLRALLTEFNCRLDSLQPYFMCVCNRWRAKLGDDALLVLHDGVQSVLACRKHGQWHSIRSVRLASGMSLAGLVGREILLQEMAADTPVYWHAPVNLGLSMPQHFESLPLPHATPVHDAALGMLLVGGRG